MEQHQFGLREWADLCERKDATIAALQARVQELEDDRSAWKEIAQDWSAAAKLAEQPEKFYEGYSAAVMNAMQALLTKARAEFTQRTAERDALKQINDTHMKTVMKLSHVVEQRTAERDCARRRVDELEAREVDVVLLREDLEKRTAELERVRGELVEATHNANVYQSLYSTGCMDRALLENELRDIRTLVLALPKVEVVTGDTVVNIVQQYNFHQWMLRALQHRQGMEG